MTVHIIGNQANFVGHLNLRFEHRLVPVNLKIYIEKGLTMICDNCEEQMHELQTSKHVFGIDNGYCVTCTIRLSIQEKRKG